MANDLQVIICAFDAAGRTAGRAFTNSNGAYTIPGLPAGVYPFGETRPAKEKHT